MTADLERREHLDLCGEWQLAFDRAGTGLGAGWMHGAYPDVDALSVAVPAAWNVSSPGVDGIGFYRKRFEIPPHWAGHSLELRFGGASYRAEAWLNGCFLGSHEGAYTPFGFDVSGPARAGTENELVVRVAGLSRTTDTDGIVLRHSPASKQSWYYTYAGLWGDVELIARDRVSIGALAIAPDLAAESARVEVTVRNDTEACGPFVLRLLVTGAGEKAVAGQAATIVAPPGSPTFAYRIPIPQPKAWSHDDPHLYTLRASLAVPAEPAVECDVQSARFGMRDFTVAGGQFYLNSEPFYLRGVILQPNYPITLIAPPDREMMVREVTLAKEAGFNLIRAHIRPAPPGFLDLCDEMGMLVYDEAPMAWIRDSPRLLDHGRREIKALIERDRNHPSVVIWGVYNENPGANALTGDELAGYARSLDPTRVVLTHSGGSLALDQDFGWIDRASMIPQRTSVPEPSEDVHIYTGAPVTPGVYEWLRTLGTPTPPADIVAEGYGSRAVIEEFYRGLRGYQGKIFVSELGYGGMADLDAVVAGYGNRTDLVDAQEMRAFRDQLNAGFAERGLDRVFGSVAGLVAACQELHAETTTRQIEAVLTNPRVSGYMLTQLNDVAWEFHAGLLDHWRRPKRAYYAVQRVNREPCVVLHAAQPAVVAGQAVPVSVTVVQPGASGPTARLTLRVVHPDGSATESTRLVPGGRGPRVLEPIEVQTGGAAGWYAVEAAMPVAGRPPVTATVRVWAVKTVAAPAGEPGVLVAAAPGRVDAAGWEALLDRAHAGQTAVVGPLRPGDETALAALRRRGLNVELHMAFGSWMGCYHWIPANPLFEGLPSRTVACSPYAGVSPQYALTELGGTVLAGSLQNTQTRLEPPRILWYSDVEAVPFGKGRVVFCQYRCFPEGEAGPVAARLARNLLAAAAGLS